MSGRGGVHGDRVVDGGRHLAGHKAAPHQPVQPVLVAVERLADGFGGQEHAARPDGLVGVLGTAARAVAPRLARVQRASVFLLDEFRRVGQRHVGQAQRVGPHVGDQADGPLAGDVDALVQLLGDGHRALRRHAELAGGLLLQRGGDERRRRRAAVLLRAHVLDGERGVLDVGAHGQHVLLALQFPLLPAGAEVPGGEGAPVFRLEDGVEVPVLLGDEAADLVLAVDDHPGGDRLHPAGGQAAPDLLPQQRAELVADDAVQHAPGLLGVHQVHVDGPGVPYALLHDVPGDLVEGDAAHGLVRDPQQLLQMPGDGLALAVRVGGQIDGGAALRLFFQFVDGALAALDGAVVRPEAVFDVHAEHALRKIPQMAHGRGHPVPAPQIFSDGLRLRRRLHDHEIGLALCHEAVLSVSFVLSQDRAPAGRCPQERIVYLTYGIWGCQPVFPVKLKMYQGRHFAPRTDSHMMIPAATAAFRDSQELSIGMRMCLPHIASRRSVRPLPSAPMQTAKRP